MGYFFCVQFLPLSILEKFFDSAIIHRSHYYGRHSRAGGNLKALALRLFMSFPLFNGVHEHSMVPDQVVDGEPPKTVINTDVQEKIYIYH